MAVIQPDLQYAASAIIPNMSENHKNRLLRLWRKALRCASGRTRWENIEAAMSDLKVTHLEHRWALQLATTVCRCKLGCASSALCRKISVPGHPHATRGQRTLLKTFRATSRSGTVSFSNRAPLLWNSLPDCQTARLPGCQTARLQSPKLPGHQKACGRSNQVL